MSSAREIVTIQAGNFANFVGTHWWNIQESSFCYTPDSSIPLDINHDVMFREGLNLQGEVTYTPRLVLVDLQDNLTSIRKECPLYRYPDEDKSETLWDGPVEVIKEKTVKKNSFLEEFEKVSEAAVNSTEESKTEVTSAAPIDFNSPSTVWCDFLKTNLHPRSFCLFQDVSSPSGDKTPLDLYSNGEDLYLKSGKDMIEDAVRKMSEECDYLQGFHVLFDAYNGFSGISNNILQYLEDEYKRIPSLCFPVFQQKEIPVEDMKEQMHRLYAILNSMNNLNSYCSFFSPLSFSDDIVKQIQPYKSFPFIEYNPSLLYHTSAIYAASIETLTSIYRLKSMKFNMGDITSAMSTYGRKLVCSSTCLPFPLSHEAYLLAMVERDVPEYYMTSLTPFYKPDTERTLFQSSVLRGVPINRFQNYGKPTRQAYQQLTPEEVFGEYLNKYSSSSVTTATVFTEKCSVAAPFPKLFKATVDDSGFLRQTATSNQKGVNKVPLAASFSSSDSAGDFIEDLVTQANKLTFKEYVKCSETTYEKDNYIEVVENLRTLQDNYQHY